VHGAIDENVHPANTMQFARALQRAGKPFDMMIYPETRHGPTGAANAHWRALQFEAIRNHLLER
jgi:dipeptidyl-peptidase-4